MKIIKILGDLIIIIFLVDSDLNEIDKESKEEVNRMIIWLYNWEPFDKIKGREIDNKIIEKIWETKNEKLIVILINIEYITMGTYQRIKEISIIVKLLNQIMN